MESSEILTEARWQQRNFFVEKKDISVEISAVEFFFFAARFYVEIFCGSCSLTVEIYGGEAALLGLSNITRAQLGHTTTQLEFTPATW